MIQINQIKILANEDISKLESKIEKALNISKEQKYTYKIIKKSIDARKSEVYIIYNVQVEIKNEEKILKYVKNANIFISKTKKYTYDYSDTIDNRKKISNRPIIVGSGPAGLFCAYMLATKGYAPLIIERGSQVELRKAKVEKFWNGEPLDCECNVQFGEGGAGTFSDGKLNTLVKDTNLRGSLVLDTFVSFGAKDNILYDAKPHIGTDVLFDILINMRKRIIQLGGEYMFDTKVSELICENGQVKGVVTNNGRSIMSDVVVLAIGHSSRDTFEMINAKGISMIPKSFAVGVRVEHPQSLIQDNQYKKYAQYLPAASYKLTYQSSTSLRGVYSFCMCPGGYVVNASSQNKMIAVNGMSYNKRDSENANSAIVVTVNPDDYLNEEIKNNNSELKDRVLSGVRFQQKIERAAYLQGKGKVPVQLLGDFANNRVSSTIGAIKPLIKGEYTLANLNNCLPKYVCDTIVEGMKSFDRKIPGFNNEETVLSGVESRTSSPVRIVRDDNTLESIDIKGLYPCGEGAGYAGGIVSAAMDGVKVFEKIIDNYKCV